MDNINFCNSFKFQTITHRTPRHTDNSGGIDLYFFAEMKSGEGRIVPLSGGEITVGAGDIFYLPRGLKYHSYWSPDESGKVEYAETNLNLETNTQVMAQWKYFDATQHKRRRSYIKEL